MHTYKYPSQNDWIVSKHVDHPQREHGLMMSVDIIQPSTLEMGALDNNEPSEDFVEIRGSSSHHSIVGWLLTCKGQRLFYT